MKTVAAIAAILLVGFLAVIPVTKHLVTKNEVERELEAALVEYQMLSREKFDERLKRITVENRLDPATLKVVVDDKSTSTVSVTIQYRSSYRVFFVPVNQDVFIAKKTAKLGM